MENLGPEKRKPSSRFQLKDALEMAAGSWLLTIPLAVTQEVWDLGDELSGFRIVLIAAVSMTILAGFVHYRFYYGVDHPRRGEFLGRVATTYGVTLASSLFILWAVDRVDLIAYTAVSIKRAVLVALPGSFVATVVDGLHDT